jgi:hypothetical protein
MEGSARFLQVLSEAGTTAASVSLALKEDAHAAKVRWLESIESTARRLATLSANVDRLSASWKQFEASVVNGTPEEDIDEVIEAMLELEETAKAGLATAAQEREQRAKGFALAFASKRERARAIAVVDRAAAAFQSAYADMQEKRLWLTAKRAELEDPGDAPVFDDFEEFVKYLDDHSR